MKSPKVLLEPEIKLETILRRYLDLPKFLDLLYSRSLYLNRADGFPDRLEGAIIPSFRTAWDEAFLRGDSKHNADYIYRRSRSGNFVSCWTESAKDNMALWHLYGGIKTCVAITTTVERLVRIALKWNENSSIHRVKYIDHSKNPDMVFGKYTDLLQYKNESYSYENEIRLIVSRQGKNWVRNPPSIRLPISSLEELICNVIVAPEAEDWFLDAINDMCERYEFVATVSKSQLAYQTI